MHFTIFNDYCTETVVNKIAPCSNSQRNEALNSVVGSKNPKIRFYGGSESNDFRVACAVAQRNLRYAYVDRTLECLNIEPGIFCTNYNDRMTAKINKEKGRKSTIKFKRRRAQKHLSSNAETSRKEAKEGTTYETGVGLNLNTDKSTTNSTEPILAKDTSEPEIPNVQAMSAEEFKTIEDIVPLFTPRPQAKQVKFDDTNYYNFLVFDTETNTTGKSAEICQLSVCDMSGSYIFSEYILPTHDIDFYASRINNLDIRLINGKRELFKNSKLVPSIPFSEAITKLQSYISQSIDKAGATTSKPIVTVFIGHNIATFDTSILLRNAGETFAHNLHLINVWFADSLTLFKELIKCQFQQLKNADGTFPKANQSSIYKALFQESFDAHDSLEDALALRKILFSSKLELSTKTIVNNSKMITTQHAVEDMKYLDHRHENMQTFNTIQFDPRTNKNGILKKNMVGKIAGAGLTYKDLKDVHDKYGTRGLIAILSKPPSSSLLSSPRVTRTRRILAAIVNHFTKS
jgi:DNA polymerase III epsilon subunit-like protein